MRNEIDGVWDSLGDVVCMHAMAIFIEKQIFGLDSVFLRAWAFFLLPNRDWNRDYDRE